MSLLALVAAAIAWTGAQAASCSTGFPLVAPPSCFEAGDGDTAAGAGKTDWSSPGLNVVTFKDDTRDTQFSGGDKENDPGTWDIIPLPGEPTQPVSPTANDVLAGAIAGELVPDVDPTKDDHVFVYGAFERTPQTGNTTTAFELNQLAPKPATATQPALPRRSDGDLFITFDGGVGSVVIRMCIWHGDDKGETTNSAYGWYSLPGFGQPGAVKLAGSGSCTRLDDAAAGFKATGAVNAVPLSPGTPLTPAFGSSLGIGSFGEISVDLTRAVNKLASAGTADKCFGFGAMALHTRSSDSGTASLKDFVEPVAIPKLTNCALELEKKVARDSGGALTFENADTAGAAVRALTGDDLQYRFEVKNPSDFPFPQASIALTELSSAGCDAAISGPTNPDGTAVDGTLNKNETWVYSCTRSGPLPAGSLVNEAKVTGTVNSKEVASATDKAYAQVIDPEITVSKSGPARAYAGDDVSFSITAENTGNDPLSNITITDTQSCDPALSDTPDSGDTGGDGIMGVGETWSWTCVVKNATGASLTNSAEVTGDDSLGNEVDDDDDHTVDLIAPEITVSKTGPAVEYAGSDVSFTITANNSGDDPITNVAITDSQSCDPALSDTPDSGDTGADGIMGVGETWTWTCVVKNATGASLTNSAEVTGDDSLGNEVGDDDDHTVDLIDPEITVSKTGPAFEYAGGDVSFTITANNSGDDPITNVDITDTPCDPALSDTPDSGDTGGDGVLGVGETWTWTCVVKNATGASLTNAAEVTGDDSKGNQVDDDDDHTVDLIDPEITVSKSGPSHAYAGDDVTFTITANNSGDDPITNVAITDTQSCDPALSDTPDSGDAGGDGIMGVGETWSWSCVVKNATGASLTNSAEVTGDDSKGNQVDDDDDHTVDLIDPELTVSKTGPAVEYAGSDVSFTITANNSGDDPITNVAITDTQSCDPALSDTPDSGDTGADGILGVGETWTWTCVVKNATGASLTNSAEVTGDDSLGNQVGDDDDHTVDLIDPELTVSKSGPAHAYAGDDVPFTITANNSGDDPLTNVQITDTLTCDPALSDTPDSGDAGSDGIMGVGETWSWSCVVKNATGASVTNSAEVTSDDSKGNEVKDDDDHTVDLIDPEITVSKTGPAIDYAGTDVTFAITAENTGDDPITNVAITDTLSCDPALSDTPDSGDTGGDGIMGVGETWSWSCVVKNATGASLTNSAEVTGDDSLGNEVKDDDDHTVDLIDPEITLTKTGPAKAHVGDDVTFAITANNSGDDPITNVDITDAPCDPALSDTPDSGDAGSDGVLGVGETWSWSCVVKNATGASLTNTASITGDDSKGNEVGATDDHTVDLIDPKLTVTKTGPSSVQHGATITWTIKAANTGTDPISTVTIKDDPCDPALSNTPDSGDTGSDGILGVGETWTWTCSTVAPSSGTSVKNVATVSGKDSLRDDVSGTGDATTQLTPVPPPPPEPEPQVEPQASRAIVGVAAFRQKATQNCVTKQFRLDVTGKEIAKVTFTVDGKVKKVLSKADARGLWSFKVNPSLKDTRRHRVNAIVEYLPGAAVKSKTLSYLYQRCTCISRRNFQIRVRTRKADPVRRAVVYVNGKRVQVIRGKRLKAPVKLIGLPKGRVTVKIIATTKSGRKLTGVRKYYTCRVKSKKKTIPKL